MDAGAAMARISASRFAISEARWYFVWTSLL
jgi:hypothetical protein